MVTVRATIKVFKNLKIITLKIINKIFFENKSAIALLKRNRPL